MRPHHIVSFIFAGLMANLPASFAAESSQSSQCNSAGGSPSAAVNACKKFSCQANEACTMASQVVKSKNDAAAQSLAKSFQKSNEIFRAGTELGNLSVGSASSLTKASNYCKGLMAPGSDAEAQDKTCESECADSKDAKYKSELTSERKKCKDQLGAVAGDLDKGASDLADSEKKSDDTAEQAQNQGSQGDSGSEPGKLSEGSGDSASSPSASTDSTDTSSTTPQSTQSLSSTYACETDEGYLNKDCVSGSPRRQLNSRTLKLPSAATISPA